jgi:hypothetical protein
MTWNRPSFLMVSLTFGLLFAGCRNSTARQSDVPPPLASTTTALTRWKLSPEPPLDLETEQPTQTDVDDFAWRSFVALNWPASELEPGKPDRKRHIGESAKAIVWETWKSPEQVFLPGGKRPAGWDEAAGELSSKCSSIGEDSSPKLLVRSAKAGDQVLLHVRAKQAVGGTLTDQHGNLARYEIRFNKPEFDYIVGRGLYNYQQQEKAGDIRFPDGSMEIKAAWRELTTADSAEVRRRFYRKRAWIQEPNRPGDCRPVEIALVGLHITHKTPNHRQWIWATFEHVDNVPPFNSSDSTGRTLPYSFHDPNCPREDCPPNQSTDDDKRKKKPTQVVRRVAISEETAKLNQRWQQRLAQEEANSPWQYYELVGAQWPKAPSRPNGEPTPTIVSNTTMETYVEYSSCMECHSTAKTTGRSFADYSFVLLEAKPATSGGAQ